MSDLTTTFENWRFEIGDRSAFAFTHRQLFGDGDVWFDLMQHKVRGHNFPEPIWEHLVGEVVSEDRVTGP